jgi:excisionase family DNA binding protein
VTLDEALRTSIREIVRDEVRAALATLRPADARNLTSAEAAELARVGQGTIRRWIREGRLPCQRAGRKITSRGPTSRA